MASTCIQQKGNNFPLVSLSDYSIQRSRLPGLEGVRFSENGEILDSSDSDNDEDEDEDEDDLPSVSEIVARSRRTHVQTRPAGPAIDLTCDTDDDDTETTSISPTNSLHLPPSSLQKSPSHRADAPTTSSTATTPGGKKYPWKNVPSWSPLHRKLQQYSNKPFNDPTGNTLHADMDSVRSLSTEFEPAPKDSLALITQRLEGSPEIPETQVVALENVRREEDNYSDDGEEHHDKSTQTVNGASMIAGDTALEVDRTTSFVPDRSHSEHDTGSVTTGNLQRADQTESIINTNNSDEAPLPIAESSEQTLAPITASGPSLPDLGEDSSAVVDISKFTTAKIVDKRSSSSGIEYMCELEPLWLAADLVGETQMGGVHIRGYENGLIRAGRVATLRVATKRKHSQI